MSRALGILLVTTIAMLVTLPAVGSPLEDAKRAGEVGEQADGYLGVVPGSPPAAGELVQRINAERAERYREIAAKSGASPAAVAALAGQKLVERASPGEWVRDADGQWRQRRE